MALHYCMNVLINTIHQLCRMSILYIHMQIILWFIFLVMKLASNKCLKQLPFESILLFGHTLDKYFMAITVIGCPLFSGWSMSVRLVGLLVPIHFGHISPECRFYGLQIGVSHSASSMHHAIKPVPFMTSILTVVYQLLHSYPKGSYPPYRPRTEWRSLAHFHLNVLKWILRF